jgi:hypothetical protein
MNTDTILTHLVEYSTFLLILQLSAMFLFTFLIFFAVPIKTKSLKHEMNLIGLYDRAEVDVLGSQHAFESAYTPTA